MNLEDIKKFLEENKDQEEVKAYVEGLSKITPNGVTAFLETDEGKKLLQPRLDKYFTTGLETWKSNNLQKLVEEEVAKKNPSETPEQKEIRELKEKFAAIEQEKTRETLKNKALSTLTEKKLPTFLLDYLIGNDEDSTNKSLTKFEETWNLQLQSVKEELLKENGTTITDGSSSQGSTDNMSARELMSQAYSQTK
ncbi:DUF4355 domain-containing protein [Halalkalibacter sp. APA_J-10(15)]|uniref:DUF4355 domain-containing protein n=1 Tax=Halalkalibacter sp. APA_J-10(15) TaxID=2933805 RepID=UPI001FF51E34|nr:DUF4355 domain-containing protein [Halalkalibacter sp. APA_J-10(15)]MCK0470885.1 DUF4355 domain-containing protein [Halalkalibacter sp. APA_J-10(15)]